MSSMETGCPIIGSKGLTAKRVLDLAAENIRSTRRKRMNLIWLEATGCSGNIISLMNAEDPDLAVFIKTIVDLRYNNSLMQNEGEMAFERFLETLDTEFILAVEGAITDKDNGKYNIIANYKGKPVSAADAAKLAAERAKHIVAVGTCASYGGITSASPNPSGSVSLEKFLGKKLVKVPGCPAHPDWVTATIAALSADTGPELDEQGRPVIFYGITIHDNCTRRSYFDQGIYAKKPGDRECMFKLGCRGSVTRTDCPIRRWNNYINWSIGDNTPCIGCAREGFPDGMEPFLRL